MTAGRTQTLSKILMLAFRPNSNMTKTKIIIILCLYTRVLIIRFQRISFEMVMNRHSWRSETNILRVA